MMSDEECDLETLTALLDDSEDEIEDPGEHCDTVRKESGRPADPHENDEAEGFLQKQNNPENDQVEKSPSSCSSPHNMPERSSNTSQDLQAELLMMKQRMKELEEKLLLSQTQPQPNQEKQNSSVTPKEVAQTGSSVKVTSTSYHEVDKNPFFPDSDEDDETPVQELNSQNSNIPRGAAPISKSLGNAPSNRKSTQNAAPCQNGDRTAVSTGNFYKKVDPKEMTKSLFGDSDSDWDELDGDEKRGLSKEGKDLKKLLTGPRNREAHKPKYSPEFIEKQKQHLPRWKESSPALGKAAFNGMKTVDDNDVNSVTDPFAGIRIINPRISMIDLKFKVDDRKVIKMSRLSSSLKTSDTQGNWVTLGVVIHKSEPRKSSKDKTFCIWKLSDLDDCDKVISFFLFGNVYKEHWKNDVGTVIGLLNPNLMDSAEKKSGDLAFTISHPQQLLVLGIARDLGRCAARTKTGNMCSNIVNKKHGEYCTYHVQSVYKKSCAKRTELQASTGVTPKNYQKAMLPKGSYYMYGGETYTTCRPSSNTKKDKVTLGKMQHQQATMGAKKVTTMSLHQLDAEDQAKLKEVADAKQRPFLEMLNTPTSGSLNFVKHLIKKENIQTEKEGTSKPLVQSVTAKDLIKQHSLELKQKREQKRCLPGVMTPPIDPLSVTPMLGKGCQQGEEIFLDSHPTTRPSKLNSTTLAKVKAVAKITAKGGIKKEDPNAVRKTKSASPDSKQKIKKRVLDSLDANSEEHEDAEPPKKRSRLLGSVDLNSEEVQKLLKTKSKHMGAVAEIEAEHEERYFSELEKKEKYEEKMSSIQEMKTAVFYCKQCKYRAWAPADRCKQEGHTIVRSQGKKRFFKCKKCNRRTITFDKFPKESCKDCGEYNFERTSMYKERAGPKLESEQLCIRGDEAKFMNSMNEKVFLNV